MDFCGSLADGRPSVLLLTMAPLSIPAKLLNAYRFLTPPLSQGSSASTEEISAFVRNRYGSQVDVLCCTADCWPLARRLMEDELISGQSIVECGDSQPGAVLFTLLEQALPEEAPENCRERAAS